MQLAVTVGVEAESRFGQPWVLPQIGHGYDEQRCAIVEKTRVLFGRGFGFFFFFEEALLRKPSVDGDTAGGFLTDHEGSVQGWQR